MTAPRCHMADMHVEESGETKFWACKTCSKTVPYEEEKFAAIDDKKDIVIIDHEFELTTEELVEVAEMMASLDELEKTYEIERKMAAAEWASKIKDAQGRRQKFSAIYRAKCEVRSVECYQDPDYKAGKMVFTSVATGEVVFERALLAEERQMKLDDIPDNFDAGSVVM